VFGKAKRSTHEMAKKRRDFRIAEKYEAEQGMRWQKKA
jgi:hypothetical protein